MWKRGNRFGVRDGKRDGLQGNVIKEVRQKEQVIEDLGVKIKALESSGEEVRKEEKVIATLKVKVKGLED